MLMCGEVLLLSMVINGCNLYFAITLSNSSGECRVLADHHQATAVKVPVTDGPLHGQAGSDIPEKRGS